jgi:hypothetical protein
LDKFLVFFLLFGVLSGFCPVCSCSNPACSHAAGFLYLDHVLLRPVLPGPSCAASRTFEGVPHHPSRT